jgi:hypothetical protein
LEPALLSTAFAGISGGFFVLAPQLSPSRLEGESQNPIATRVDPRLEMSFPQAARAALD